MRVKHIFSIAFLLFLSGCNESSSWDNQKIIFQLLCKPDDTVDHSLKGDPVFSNGKIIFRYGTSEKSYRVTLGEEYVIDELSPSSIVNGGPVPEPIYRLGGSSKYKRYTFAVERKGMGVVIYTYQEEYGLLTEVYLNYEYIEKSDLGIEAVILSQSKCERVNA